MQESDRQKLDPAQKLEACDALDNSGGRLSPNCSDYAVEASVKTVVVLLFSIVTTSAGVFIRSCQSIPAELLQAWCGGTPRAVELAQHQHCSGCVLVVVGLMIGALSLMLNPRTLKAAQVFSR